MAHEALLSRRRHGGIVRTGPVNDRGRGSPLRKASVALHG
jgi:hypothetical protein